VFVVTQARVTESSVASLESKTDQIDTNGVRCGVNVPIPRCAASEAEAFHRSCFVVKGNAMTQYGETGLDKLQFTKLSD
jgi:hypothetical protein